MHIASRQNPETVIYCIQRLKKGVFEMSRVEMQNKIIRTLGFEHPDTIEFFEACEMLQDNVSNNKILEKVLNEVLTNC